MQLYMNLKYYYFSLFLIFILLSSNALADNCSDAIKKLTNVITQNNDNNKLNDLQEIKNLCPNFVEIHYELGRFYLSDKKYNEALSSFKMAESLKPRLEHLIGIGTSLTNLKIHIEAENIFKEAIAKYSSHWRAIEGLGVLYLNLGRYKESEDLFNQALQDESNTDSLYYNLGVSLERQGRVDESIISFKTALLKNNRNKEARVSLINIYFSNGKYSEANSLIEDGLFIFPKDNDLLLLNADMLDLRGEIDEALEIIERIQNLEQGVSKELNLKKAVFYIKKGNSQEGIDILKSLFDEDNSSINVIKAYTWALIYLKNFELAKEILVTSLQLYPDNYVLLNNYGVLLEETGFVDSAKDYFRRAALYNPSSEVIQNNQIRVQ